MVEFPADKANFSGEMADQLSALVKSGAIRVLDLLFLKNDSDGSVEGFESHEFEDSEVGQLRELETELALLPAEEDVEAIGAALELAGNRPRSLHPLTIDLGRWHGLVGKSESLEHHDETTGRRSVRL